MDIQIIFNKVKGNIKVAAVVDSQTLVDNPTIVKDKAAKLHNPRVLIIQIPDEKVKDLYSDQVMVLAVNEVNKKASA